MLSLDTFQQLQENIPKAPKSPPVYRNSTGTHRGHSGIRPRQSYGNDPVWLRSSPVMPRRSPGECWFAGGVPAERRFTDVP